MALVDAVRIRLERHPQVRRRIGREAPGQNADDGRRLAVNGNGAAQNRPLAPQPRLPESVAQHRHRRAVGQVLLRGERAAHHRRRAEHAEKTFRNPLLLGLLRAVAGAERRAGGPLPVQRHRLERLVLPPHHVLGNRVGEAVVGSAVIPAHPHDAVRLGIGKRLQQYVIDHREDRRVGADAERQRRHRDRSESRDCRASSGRQNEDLRPGFAYAGQREDGRKSCRRKGSGIGDR